MRVKVPGVKLPPFLIPIFALNGILYCLEDLLSLGALAAPNAEFGKKRMSLKEVRDLVGIGILFFESLRVLAGENLCQVHIGADDVDVQFKIV